MRFALTWTGVFLGSVLLLGCSASDLNHDPNNPNESEETSNPPDITLAFEDGSAVELTPGEDRTLTATLYPPQPAELFFTLIDAPSDTSLDASNVRADADGRASVSIHAPSTPAIFTLRVAMKDGPKADVSISVNKQGVGVVEVVPDYTGQRPVTDWVGAVVIGTTCDALKDQLPGEPQGSLVAVSQAGENPLIQSVPVGPKLAVHVRAGHFAWGCTDAYDVSAGATSTVKVHVVDVPPAMDQTALNVTFAFEPEAAGYSKILSTARDAFVEAMFPPDSGEALTMLSTMEQLSPNPTEFAAARAADGWDGIVEGHFAALPAPITSRMHEWVKLGFQNAKPEVSGEFVSVEGVPDKALFMAKSVAGLDAAAAGTPLVHLMSWAGDINDAAFLGGELFFLPSRLVGAACREGSEKEFGPLESMTDALSQAVACGDLATLLGGSQTCDVACLTEVCSNALATRWEIAQNLSAYKGSVGTIEIGASGVVQVNDVATPVAFSGSWLGIVSDGETSAESKGPVTGVALVAPEEETTSSDPPQ